jgi:NAD-dependent dihydropyrimidine dehydrogenase PreA subunit
VDRFPLRQYWRHSVKYLANVVALQLDQDLCTGRGMCKIVCPHAVFSLDNGLARIGDRDACMECGACSLNCPEKAIFVQAGVGCAQAVINSTLNRTGTDCCSLEDYEQPDPGCASPDTGCGCAESPPKRTSSGCC